MLKCATFLLVSKRFIFLIRRWHHLLRLLLLMTLTGGGIISWLCANSTNIFQPIRKQKTTLDQILYEIFFYFTSTSSPIPPPPHPLQKKLKQNTSSEHLGAACLQPAAKKQNKTDTFDWKKLVGKKKTSPNGKTIKDLEEATNQQRSSEPSVEATLINLSCDSSRVRFCFIFFIFFLHLSGDLCSRQEVNGSKIQKISTLGPQV